MKTINSSKILFSLTAGDKGDSLSGRYLPDGTPVSNLNPCRWHSLSPQLRMAEVGKSILLNTEQRHTLSSKAFWASGKGVCPYL